jgi:hypothetical protein
MRRCTYIITVHRPSRISSQGRLIAASRKKHMHVFRQIISDPSGYNFTASLNSKAPTQCASSKTSTGLQRRCDYEALYLRWLIQLRRRA